MGNLSSFLKLCGKMRLITQTKKCIDIQGEILGLRTDQVEKNGQRNGRFYLSLRTNMVYFVWRSISR